MTPESLNDLLRQHHPMIRAVCWRILNDDSDADDAAQNAMISIARRIDTFDGRSAITTWIYRIATNAALDEIRRRRRRPRPVGDRSILTVVDSSSERAMDTIDGADQLNAALAQIPEEFRVALILRDVVDLDYEEIGRILNVPGGTVRSRIARGRARLADLLGNPTAPDERPMTERMPANTDAPGVGEPGPSDHGHQLP
ncbi:MAG: RNA polymerase sigma factor [Ilumatobacteraceae bacterium]